MKGFKFDNARRSREARFMALELLREAVNAARAQNEAYSEMIMTVVTDIGTDKWGANTIGAASDEIDSTALLGAVFNGMLEMRRAGDDYLPDVPDTGRLVGVALISGADTLGAEMRGGSKISSIMEKPDQGKLLSRGYLATIVFADLESAVFMGQETGTVDFVGSSAPIDVDAYSTKVAQLPDDENAEHVLLSDLALIVAAITARDDELSMLGG